MKLLKDLYNYRELLKTSVKKDIRGRYKGSFLGVLWTFLNPLLLVVVYAIVFPHIMKIQTEHYLQFLICGIIPWNYFSSAMAQGMDSIKNNAGVIKKVYFPREILPISACLSGLINFLISTLIILIFCIFGGLGVSWHLIFLPVFALLQFFITTGLVLGLSAINVYIQDMEYIIQFVINLAFYVSPILYDTMALFPDSYKWILYLNPFTYLIIAYRDIFMVHILPPRTYLFALIGFSVLFLGLGLLIFRKLEKNFAEVI